MLARCLGGGSAGVSGACGSGAGDHRGLFVFLVCAAILALLGAGAEAGMVETVAIAMAAWGGGGCGRPAVAGLANSGTPEPDLLHLLYGGWLQGVELVHENRRFVRAQTGVIHPFDNLLVFAEAVRAQNNALKLLACVFH